MSTPCSGKVKLPLVLKPTLTRLLMRRKMVSARPVESISGWTVSNFVTLLARLREILTAEALYRLVTRKNATREPAGTDSPPAIWRTA